MMARRLRFPRFLALLPLPILGAAPLRAQIAITAATTLTTDAPDTVHEGFTFQNTVVALQTFTAGGATYTVGNMAEQVFIRRRSGGANEAHVWYQTSSAGGARVAPYASTYASVLLDNNLSRGVHNLFGNSGSGVANIERVDFITPSGFSAAPGFAIPVFDFGINPQHKSFRIALVTAVDGSGNPTAFSQLASTIPFIASNIYTHNTFSIHRYNQGDTTTANYTIFNSAGAQGPGGVVFTLDDFNVPVGTTIYGYSLFGYDVSDGGNTANLLDWNNATYFPTNTSSGEQQAGGFDFSGVNGVYFQDIAFSVIPEPASTLGGLGLICAGILLRRRRRESFVR